MPQDTAQQLATHLRDHLGQGLRAVVVDHQEEIEMQYLRSDLQEAYSTEIFVERLDRVRLEAPFVSPTSDATPVGECNAVIQYHEQAVFIHFPLSNTESILVSLSQESGHRLLPFIENCSQIVEHTD